jgi:hypothetical protein
VKALHPRTGQALAEVRRKGPPQVRAAELDAANLLPVEKLSQSANGCFDFRQFGHARDMAVPRQAR